MRMRRFGSMSALALALAGTLALPVQAQNAKPAEQKEMKQEMKQEKKAPAPPSGMRASILGQLDQAREKLLALANAMPAEKYTWRPAPGVRSVGEVFAHVASANYFLTTFWDAKIPAGVDPKSFDKTATDKAKTIEVMTMSFEHVRQEILTTPDKQLSFKIKLFGKEATILDDMLTIVSHDHEHLGQAIAYARSNGVTPPWSQ